MSSLAAKNRSLPLLTFVEPEVINFQKVYRADPKAALWTDFQPMDHPEMTFRLVDEVSASPTNNGIILFSSVGDAQKKLKLQIADFVGTRLSQTASPMNTQLREVLAEISTVRNLLVDSSDALKAKEEEAKRYHAATRFLLTTTSPAIHRSVVTGFVGVLLGSRI